MDKSFRILLIVITLFLVISTIKTFAKEPSNNRDWSTDQAILPTISINNNFVTIKNIRDFDYVSTTQYTPRYYNQTFNLEQLSGVDFILEDIPQPGLAHTFLSFEFTDPVTAEKSHVAISAEIRKEKDESYNPIKGLMRNYELMYVIASERDVINLRANHRKDDVYLYRIQTSYENARQMFLSMIERAQELENKPEFYNTLTNTCATNIVSHVNAITRGKIPFSFSILTPKHIDQYAYELGLLDTSLSLEQLKSKAHINSKAAAYTGKENFSELIRK